VLRDRAIALRWNNGGMMINRGKPNICDCHMYIAYCQNQHIYAAELKSIQRRVKAQKHMEKFCLILLAF
jgi:hypothetical protein